MNTDLFPETLLVKLDHGHSFTTSRKVAEHFHKRHKNVLRDIEVLLADISRLNFEPRTLAPCASSAASLSPNMGSANGFNRLSFEPITYLDSRNRPQTEYRLSHDAFSLLAMGFTGKEALLWKLKFLDAFNVMEAALHARTERFATALDQVRPSLRPVVEGTEQGLSRADIAAPLGRSCASVSYHRKQARRLGLFDAGLGLHGQFDRADIAVALGLKDKAVTA